MDRPLAFAAMLCFLGTGLVALGALAPPQQVPLGLLRDLQAWLLSPGLLTWLSMVHTAGVGALGTVAMMRGQLSRERAGELTKITGYLYTLIGLLLVFNAMKEAPADPSSSNALSRVMPGVGTAILSSVVGWLVGTLLEGDSYLAQDDELAAAALVPPPMPIVVDASGQRVIAPSELPAEVITALRTLTKSLEEAAKQGSATTRHLEALGGAVQQFQTFVTDAASITESLRKLLEREGPWREHQEQHLERVCRLLQDLLQRTPPL